MAKKKDKPQVINNIQELNLEIDYNKLAEAIVKAKQIEEDNATKKNAEDLAAWRRSIGKKDHEDKKGLMKKIFVVCNRIKVSTKIIFYPKNKRLYKSMTGAVMQGVPATFFNVVKWFLWVLTAGFIGSLFFHGETEFTFLQYCTSIGRAILAFMLAGIFRLMAIETEQMTDRERILGIFTAVVSVYPLIEKAIELFKGVG